MDIGLFPISAKPFHKGHNKLISIASNENDAVIVIISLTDRVRKNEFPIYGKDMALIWRDHLSATLPSNAKTLFLTSSPIRKTYEILGDAEYKDLKDKYFIYGDKNDLTKNFPLEMMERYYPTLSINNLIALCPYDRQDIEEISGTIMREYLANEKKEDFIKMMPENVNGEQIYTILTNANKSSQ